MIVGQSHDHAPEQHVEQLVSRGGGERGERRVLAGQHKHQQQRSEQHREREPVQAHAADAPPQNDDAEQRKRHARVRQVTR